MNPSTSPPTGGGTALRPLCVALEGGVLRNGLVAEVLLPALKNKPSLLVRVLPGFPGTLRRVARRLARDVESLSPAWNPEVRERVEAARADGRPVVLVTAAPPELLEPLGEEIGRYDEVMAVQGRGADLGRALAERFGTGGFDFVGGRGAVKGVRPFAREASVAPPPASDRGIVRIVARTIRTHQWLKNLLIFLPVLAGQRFTEGPVVLRAGLAFVAFSLVASSVYVINDLLDLQDDRRHPRKRHRPFASGALPLSLAPFLIGTMLAVAGAVTAYLLPPSFALVLGAYLVLTFAYSLKLKGAILVDVVTLAGLYTLRIIAGAAATGIEPSVWLLGFSLFFFTSLALVKRYAELHGTASTDQPAPGRRLPGRSYQPRDLPVLIALGVGTGCVAVLILALYVISDEFTQHYRYPVLLWQLCPLTLYWIGRAWIVVARDEMTDDPVVWAVRDQLSRWVGVVAVLILVLAR